MPHAEHGGSGEPRAQQPIEMVFRRLVHGRGRLVEEEPIGPLDERVRKGDALLLTGRQPQRSVAGLVEPFSERG